MNSAGNNSSEQSPTVRDNVKSPQWLVCFALFFVVFVLIIKHFSAIEKDFLLLRNVQPFWLAAAIIAQMITYVFAAFIYRFLLQIFHLANLPGLGSLVKASIVSLFFNQTVPSAGISGNAFFFRYISSFNVPAKDTFLLILAELLTYYAAAETLIFMLLLTCLFFTHLPHVIVIALVIGVVAYLIFSVIIVLVGRENLFSRIYTRLKKSRLLAKLVERRNATSHLKQIGEQGIQLAKLIKSEKGLVLKVYFLQLTKAAPDAFTLFALFHGMGVSVSFYTVLLCLVCTQIVSLLPFLPGSLVLYESSMSFFFTVLHVPFSSAVVVTLLFRFLSFWVPIPLGLFFYRRWMRSVAA
jgi:uncharacterized protein (TIRG00374 family)